MAAVGRRVGHDADANAFARSYSKLLEKGVPFLDLAEAIFRARLIGANARLVELFSSGAVPRFVEGRWVKTILSLEEAKRIAGDPAGFDRGLTRTKAELRLRPLHDGDLTGLPSWTLRRRARDRQPLSADEAQVLDESPFGSQVLRSAQRAGIPIESLRQANFAALPEIVRDVSQSEIERGAQQFLVELVHRTTRKWYFTDLANLLRCDRKRLEDRSRDFRDRQTGGRKLLKSMRPYKPG